VFFALIAVSFFDFIHALLSHTYLASVRLSCLSVHQCRLVEHHG